MDTREIVARNLRRLRQKSGLTQEELADRAEIDRNYPGKLERGENSPTVDMLDRIARILDVDVIDFFRRD